MKTYAALCWLSLACACASTAKDPAAPAASPTGASADTAGSSAPADAFVYPAAQRQDIVDQLHGVRVADPYRWLEDPNDPEVGNWLAAQDALARARLRAVPVRDALESRFRELLYLDSIAPPQHRNGRYFYTRKHKDKEKAILYWKEGPNGRERVLLDPHTMSNDGTVSLRGWYVSWDGKKVAYKLSKNNADEAIMYVRDVATGQDSAIDVIPGVKYSSASWTPDGRGFYYSWLPQNADIPVAERPGYTEFRYHALGTDSAADTTIFPATRDPKTFLYGNVTRDGRFLIITVQHGWNRTDVYMLPPDQVQIPQKSQPPTPIDQMTTDQRVDFYAQERGFMPVVTGYEATFTFRWWQGHFYIYTNYGAPNYRVFKTTPQRMNISDWVEIIPEGKAKMDGLQVIGNHLVVPYLRNATSEIAIYDLNGTRKRQIPLPELGSATAMVGNPDQDEAYFAFSSFTRPTEIYRTSIQSGQTSLWDRVEVPIDTANMVAKQVWYQSKDSTKVSMFVVHAKDTKLDGNNPVLLYGYGGFNISLEPRFSSLAAAWLERGGIYAVANLRGGGEYGERWHKAGMLLNKQNVFDDFIAAAEYLIAKGYTNPGKLAIYGGSNGGLLVGAAMTQRPELFQAVICAVPLLDMVRYHLFGSGKTWIPEYGSADDPEQFAVLHAYSPYHRIQPGTEYPALLMMTADSDDRVDPLHARKFAAAIQWATADKHRPALVRLERNAGHGGADLVKQNVERYTDMLAFLTWQLGM